MRLPAFIIFIGAFLLFLVEPLAAKQILPWFGGAPAVWNAAMLFFQLALLAGYCWAHLVTSYTSPRAQRWLQFGLLLLSLLAIPLSAKMPDFQGLAGWPAFRVVLTLGILVGLPFLVLSTTSPLLQAWAGQNAKSTKVYRLYALSNAASLLGLLSYPFLLEPRFSLAEIRLAWSWGYGAYAALFVIHLIRLKLSVRSVPATITPHDSIPRTTCTAPDSMRQGIFWLILPCIGSVMLLAVTNHCSQDIAAVPLLWTLPLALYLASFVLAFSQYKFYVRAFWLSGLLVSVTALLFFPGASVLANWGINLLMLFCGCMICHGELAAIKPPPAKLTAYYLCMTVGSGIGSLLVVFGAPALFTRYSEYPLSFLACILAYFVLRHRQEPRQLRYSAIASVLLFVLAALVYILPWDHTDVPFRGRNFFAVTYVKEDKLPDSKKPVRLMVSGSTAHGMQLKTPGEEQLPISYFGPQGGAGIAMNTFHTNRPRHVGVLGLGAGILAAYGRPGDSFIFYEIDPLVVEIAKNWFSFLSASKAKTSIVLDDARLALDRAAPENFDLLFIDAFSGDAVPLHLISKEAMEIYLKHLAPDGVLIYQLSNRYLELTPVVKNIADHLGLSTLRIVTGGDLSQGYYGSDFIFVTRNAALLETAELRARASAVPATPGARMWDDGYANILGALKGGVFGP